MTVNELLSRLSVLRELSTQLDQAKRQAEVLLADRQKEIDAMSAEAVASTLSRVCRGVRDEVVLIKAQLSLLSGTAQAVAIEMRKLEALWLNLTLDKQVTSKYLSSRHDEVVLERYLSFTKSD